MRHAETMSAARAAGEKAGPTLPVEPPPVASGDDARPEPGLPPTSRPACLTGRPRLVDPTASETDLSAAEAEFMQAMHEYKRRRERMFPTWSEVLVVLQGLGYEKVSELDPKPAPQAGAAGGAS